MRVAFISLILKKTGALSIKDLWPISLIRSLYKILAKVMASRLRTVFPDIIYYIQGYFVDGRQILDSILKASDCIDSRNRQHCPGLVCKLDFEKAYDMVDWRLFQYMMAHMGFGNKWCKWINCCFSTAQFSLLMNGFPKVLFLFFHVLQRSTSMRSFICYASCYSGRSFACFNGES